MISVAQAFAEILEAIPPAPTEDIPLAEAAGRVLRDHIRADRDAPPFDRVMLDGVALCGAALAAGQRRFRVVGSAPAGAKRSTLPAPDVALEVMTGAPLPEGADVVAPVEALSIDGEWVEITREPQPGDGIHARASQAWAGDVVLEAGTRLDPAAMAVLATEGVMRPRVAASPHIHLVTTGDEVVPPEQTPMSYQIRASHPLALRGLFAAHGHANWTHSHASDEESALLEQLGLALEGSDLLLVTGGVSKGARDHVPRILNQLGVKTIFHGVAQRPGKPFWFGTRGSQCVFALPGNPLSALTCARRHVLPALEHAARGRIETPWRVRPNALPAPHPQLTTFPLVFRENGQLHPRPATNSGALHEAALSSGFLECPAGEFAPETLAFYPWTGA